MVRPTLIERIPEIQNAIKKTAWKQIAETGAAALSLRAIARELNITAPAIYNYFSNRDALVTALILDAYNALADTQDEAIDIVAADDLPGQFTALGLSYRTWAVMYPQRYLLIFGTPIPNYHAPADITRPAATRGLIPLIHVIQALHDAGKLHTERMAEMTPKLKSMLAAWENIASGTELEVLYLALVIWSRVHGMVMLELGDHIPPVVDDPSEVFNREIKTMLMQYLS